MGYLHISNLYRPEAQIILLLRECIAKEKVHGTSAHVAWKDGQLTFSSGGESHERFCALFDEAALRAAFELIGQPEVVVYGEAYGGKCQGMRHTYGDALRFIVFDVKIGTSWLGWEQAVQVVEKLGLEAVPWRKVSTDLAVLDAERDRPSEVAVRRGITEPMPREGVVLVPVVELTTNNGNRVMAKHKGEAFSERATPQKVVDPSKLQVLTDAQAVADEWVTPNRLQHVLQRVESGVDITAMPQVINLMIEDVLREASGEIVESREVKAAISRKTAETFKAHLKSALG